MNRNSLTKYLGVVTEDMVVDHDLVGMDVDVGKHQTGDHTDYQRDRVLLKDVYVVGANQIAILYFVFQAQGANVREIISSKARL